MTTNICKICGREIPPTGEKGRPRQVHEACAPRREAKYGPPSPTPAPTPMPSPTPTAPVPALPQPITNAPAPADAAALVGIIQSIAGNSIDAEQVRKIATEAALDVVSELDITAPVQVVLNGVELPPIDGTQHEQFATVLRLISLGMHTYLVGPPGTGKSTIAHHAAIALGLEYGAIACGPTTPTSRLFGFIDAAGIYHTTEFRQRFEHGGVFLLDEMDNGHPGLLAELNQALANGHAAFPDGMVARHDKFVVVAAANTFGAGSTEFVGRCALDKATLDRFVKVYIGIDETMEETLACAGTGEHGRAWLPIVRKCRANAAEHGIKVIISPRASIYGARMLAAGFLLGEVLDMTFLSGLGDDQRSKVLTGVRSS